MKATMLVVSVSGAALAMPVAAAPVSIEADVSQVFRILSIEGGPTPDPGLQILDEGNPMEAAFAFGNASAVAQETTANVADPAQTPIQPTGEIAVHIGQSSVSDSIGAASAGYLSQLFFFNAQPNEYQVTFQWDTTYSYDLLGWPQPKWDYAAFWLNTTPMCGAAVNVMFDGTRDGEVRGGDSTSCTGAFTVPAASNGANGFTVLNFGYDIYAEVIAPEIVPLPASMTLGLSALAALGGLGAVKRRKRRPLR